MHEGKGLGSALDRHHTSSRAPERQQSEHTSEQRAAGDRAVADNVDHQLELVRAGVAAMDVAAGAHELAGWAAAKGSVDQALRQLEHLAKAASLAARDAIEPDVRQRLANADQRLPGTRRLVAQAPSAPVAVAPELRCGDALLAALPPDPPPAAWREADFQAAADAVAAICTQQMTTSDITAFRRIVTRHEDDVIARRFRRLGAARRRRLLGLLAQSDVKRSARAREAARREEVAAQAWHRPVAAEVDPDTADGLDPPGVPPPPYLGGRLVETMSHRVQAIWKLNPAGTDYILYTMYPIP